MDSDHRLLVADLRVKAEVMKAREKRSVIRIDALRDEGKKQEYIAKVNEHLERREVGEEANGIQKVIIEAAEESLGRRWIGGTKKKHTPWWNEEVREAVKKKVQMMRKWLKNRTQQSRDLYVEARNRAESVKRGAKREAALKLAEELIEDEKGDRKKIYKLAKSYRGSKTKVCNIKNKQGEVLLTPEEQNGRFTEHFSELLNVDEREDIEWGELEGTIEEALVGEDISMEEYQEALAKMKNGKSPGEDEIPIELIKEGGEKLQHEIVKFLNKCWNEGKVPENFGKSIIIPIYK